MTQQVVDIDFIKMQVDERIAHIGSKLKEQDPLLPVHLSAIHQALIQYEELVHLLDDTQIATLIQGQKKHVGVTLVQEATKASKASVSKRIPKTTVDDL